MTTSLLRVLFASSLLVLQAGGSTGVPPLFADVRIVGGPNITCGRVEVLSSTAVWGTVCDDLWDDLDAFVICRQLGFSGGKAFRNAFFGPGTGPIHLDDVRCTGFEPTINMCPYTSDTTSLPINCQHNEDASVCCDQPGLGLMHPVTTTPAPLQIHYDVCPMRPGRPPVPPQNIRLVGSIPGVGYVQTRAPNNTWGYVCDDYFGLNTATVVCRELCYDWIHARPSMHQQFYVKVTDPYFILDDVMCNGSEAQLQDCNHRPFFQHNCDSTEIAAVTCIPDTQLQCTNCFSPPPDLHCRNEDMIVIFNLTETPDLEAKHISFVNMGNTCSVSSYTVDNLITVIIRYDECGTDIKQNATHLIYFNTMIIMYTSQFEDITDRNDFRLELSCAIPRNYSSSNIVVPETVIVQQSSTMYLNVTVSFTKDDRFGTIVTTVPYPVVLGCWLNVTVNLHTNDPRMKLIVTDCRASPEYQQPVVPSHPLITDKCPAYPGLRMVPLTLSRFGFMYPVFGFVNHTNIVIECDALVCLTTDNTAECDQSCNSNNKTNIRGRRSSPFAKQSKKAKSPPFFVTGEDGHPLDQQYSNHSKVGFIIEKIALPNVVSEAKTTPEAKSTPEAKTTPKVRPTNSGVHQTTSVLSSSQHHATDVLHDESKNGTEIHPNGPVLIAPKSVDRVLVDNGCTLCLSPLLFTSVVVFSYYVHIF